MFDFFRKKPVETPALPSPLNLRLGGAVQLDLLPFEILSDQLYCTLPQGTQVIEAAGFIDLGAGAAISRFYTADDGFIQVSTTGGYEVQHIDDIKLFVFEQTHSIGSQQAADHWAGDQGFIGQSSFLLKERAYQRAWDATIHEKIAPVKVTESVHTKDPAIEPYEVDHLMMLYQRVIENTDKQEYVLTSLEFTGEEEATAVISVGVNLELSSMTIM